MRDGENGARRVTSAVGGPSLMKVEHTIPAEAPMSPHTVEVQDLSKTYPGGVEAVRGIDFDVSPGEVFGLLGPNGAGKSTTIGMLTTAIAPPTGRARVG